MMVALGALAAFLAFFLWWRLWFFLRDPERRAPAGSDLLAPADGYVVYAKSVRAGEVPVAYKRKRSLPLEEYTGAEGFGEADGVLVGTYMTTFSVHRNRIPLDGEVVFREHRAARRNASMVRLMTNLLLRRPPYDEQCRHVLENERLTIGIRTPNGVVLVTQIADAWIRRILARVQVGQRVRRGERYGLIRFGSQVDVFLPDSLGVVVCVEPGQRVRAGETVLARREEVP